MRELIRQTIERARREAPDDTALRLAAELIRIARIGSSLHMTQAAGLLAARQAADAEERALAEAQR